MINLKIINFHVYASIIATFALIALLILRKNGKEHFILGYTYTIGSLITILTIMIASWLFLFNRWLEHKPFILFVGRFTDQIMILHLCAQLFTGFLFIPNREKWKKWRTMRSLLLINLPIFALIALIICGFYTDDRMWNVLFCSLIFLFQLPVFLFSLWLLGQEKKGKMNKYLSQRTIHSSQMLSSSITFIFMGMGANLGKLLLGATSNMLRFNLKTVIVFPLLNLIMGLYYKRKLAQKNGPFPGH